MVQRDNTDSRLAHQANPRCAFAFHLQRFSWSGQRKNHGFKDGNKRTGFMAMYVLLALNGLEIVAPEEEVVAIMEGIAKSDVSEQELVRWLRGRTVPLEGEPE